MDSSVAKRHFSRAEVEGILAQGGSLCVARGMVFDHPLLARGPVFFARGAEDMAKFWSHQLHDPQYGHIT